MFVQVPGVPPLQVWHVAHDAEPQQTLSTQLPLKHSPASEQDWPLSFLQEPLPSQELVPTQALAGKVSSWPLGTLTQEPTEPATLQALQVPAHALAQHTPSTQLALRQVVPMAQACPLTDLHPPVPSHCLF